MESNIIRQKETIYFFGKEYNADKYVKLGLSSQEEFFSWTNGKTLKITTIFADVQPESVVHTLFRLAAVFTDKQKVVVQVNKDSVYSGTLYSGNDLSFDFRVPQGGEVEISVDLPEACSPKSLNLSEDVRLLALAIRSIEFTSEDKNNPEFDIAIQVNQLIKNYKIYDKPVDRLKESLSPFRKKFHRKFAALNNISFEIKKGETVGIIGKNGSGKSTLLKILTGVLTPSSGYVKTNGKISALLELGAGFNPDFTGMENIYFNGSVMGYTKEEIDGKIDDIIKFADIGDFINQPVKLYSSGMFVRLAFALAISVDPDILIVDEALAVGDSRFQLKCFQKFDEFIKQGKTLLLVSHSIGDITRLCKRTIWLNDGMIRRDGESIDVTEEYNSWMFHDAGNIQETADSDSENNAYKANLMPVLGNMSVIGDGGAIIEGIGLFNEKGNLVNKLTHSGKVKIVVQMKAINTINNPYFSFHIVDKKGMMIMGSNNHVLRKRFSPIEAGKRLRFDFDFFFPEISNGEYFISIGIDDGEMDNHIILQYIIDAFSFFFDCFSPFQKQGNVLFKLPDCKCEVEDVE